MPRGGLQCHVAASCKSGAIFYGVASAGAVIIWVYEERENVMNDGVRRRRENDDVKSRITYYQRSRAGGIWWRAILTSPPGMHRLAGDARRKMKSENVIAARKSSAKEIAQRKQHQPK